MSKRKEIDLNLLERLYKNHRFSTTQLAALFEVSRRTIQRRLNEIGIDLLKDTGRDEFGRIHSKESKLPPMIRENNGKYKGGISIYRDLAFNEYGFEEKCFHCETTEDIIIHHIDGNRYNNTEENLRPCCKSCHMKIEHPDNLEKAREALRIKRENEKKEREKEGN